MKLNDSDELDDEQTPEKFIEDMLSPFSRYFKGNLDYDTVSSPEKPGTTYERAKEIFGSSTDIVSQNDVDRVKNTIKENTQKIVAYIEDVKVETPTEWIIYNSLKEIQEKYAMLEHVLYIEAKRGGYPVRQDDIRFHQEKIDGYMHQFYGERLSDTPDERDITIDYIDKLDRSKLSQEEQVTLTELLSDLKALGYEPDRVQEIQEQRKTEIEEQHIRHRTQMFKHFGRGYGSNFAPLNDEEINTLLMKEEPEVEERMEQNNLHTNAPAKKNDAGEDIFFTYKSYKRRKEKLATTTVDIDTRVNITNKVLGIYGEMFPHASIKERTAVATSASGSSSKHEDEEISISDKLRTVNDFLAVDVGHELEI